jgi:EAL domain-containing protein (putative c-di-GMP-specific phosphodiesterase class I)
VTLADARLPDDDLDAPSPLLEVKKVLAGMSTARLAFQPVADLDHGEVVGYEALARFGSGTHRSPGPYFYAADQLDVRDPLEALLVQTALDARPTAPEGCWIALNVTPTLLLGGATWSVLTSAGDLTGVVIELTEHAPVNNLPRLRRRLDTLRDCGAVFALDDVGAGWSGLQQVVELRPEIVKIDRSLVQNLHENPSRRAITELLHTFTQKVGGRLLAEGVEQLAELTSLIELDVHLAQGWLLGRPQFGWPGIPAAASSLLEAGSRAERQVGGLAVPTPSVRSVAAVGFLGETLPRAAILLDEDHRLQALWLRNPASGGPSGWVHEATTIRASTPNQQALRDAMQRPAANRFDPLVCVDGDGDVIGLIHVEELIAAVTG